MGERDKDIIFDAMREDTIDKVSKILIFDDISEISGTREAVDIVLKRFGLECKKHDCHRRSRSNGLCMKHWQNARSKYHRETVEFYEKNKGKKFEDWLKENG